MKLRSVFNLFLFTMFLLSASLPGCAGPTPTASLPAPTETATLIPAPTDTPSPSATAIRTPPVLPATFVTAQLNPLDTPHAYIQDSCQYLRDKWSSTNSAPGTVVMVIMFHSIPSEEIADPNQILQSDFEILMNDLHEQGFQAINMQQLADFLNNNASIPPRSVVLLVDDRRFADYYNSNFRRYWDQWGWPVVNAFISFPDNTQALWDENAALETEGFVDHQAHGVIHNINIGPDSSDDYILSELNGAISAFQQHFNKAPIAIIWPGGGFTPHAAELARGSGYQLGFTINPRGPVMFNWIPLSDTSDPMRPSYMPEGAVNDPRMVLPRYWAPDADAHIDTVRLIGKEAAAYAEQNRAVELEYYDIICAPTYGPMP
jgi:hypothetical protein